MLKKIIIFILVLMSLNSSVAIAKNPKKYAGIAKNYHKKAMKKVVVVKPNLYKTAQTELGSPLYEIYRVVERLSRCNKLDEYSWRINLDESSTSVNAATTDGNLIIIDYGMIDCFGSDVSAMAFIISHEMAHQIGFHASRQFDQKIAMENKIEQLKNRLQVAQDNYNNRVQSLNQINNQVNSLGYYGGGSIGSIINTVSSTIAKTVVDRKIDNAGMGLANEVEQIKNDLMLAQQDYITFKQNLEYESDVRAIEFMTIAGFEPNASLRTFKFFRRISFSRSEDDHPNINNRIGLLNSIINNTNVEELKSKGKEQFVSSKPLTYSFNNERTYLKINSSYGSYADSNKPFEDLFGY